MFRLKSFFEISSMPHPARVARLFRAVLVGADDLGDVLWRKLVLAFAFHEVLGGVDEEHVVGLLAFLEHKDADGDTGGVEEVRRQADDGVDVAAQLHPQFRRDVRCQSRVERSRSTFGEYCG